MAQQPPVGQGHLIIETSRSHSLGLLWTSDQTYERQTSLPPVGFEPAIPGSEQPDRGLFISICNYYMVVLTVEGHYIARSLFKIRWKPLKLCF